MPQLVFFAGNLSFCSHPRSSLDVTLGGATMSLRL